MSIRTSVFTLCFFLIFSTIISAQVATQLSLENPESINHTCGTPPMTRAERMATIEQMNLAQSRNAGMTALPVRIHIVTEDDGSGGIAEADLNVALSYVNYHYYPSGIEFYICSFNVINSSEYYTYSKTEEAAMFAAHSVTDAANVYFVGDATNSSGGSICGYAKYPFNSATAINIVMDNDCTLNASTGTLVHEFGHFFNLQHTHDGTEDGNADADAENVARTGANSNCTTNGDMCCDTPADPNGSNDAACNYINDGTDTEDMHGETYVADVSNTMSYYSDYCGGVAFTDDQSARIVNALATRLAHTNYDIDGCAPTVVADPSGIVVVQNDSYGIDISWTDNSANETGFFIERSQDGGATWRVLDGGGVGPDVVTFTDQALESNQTYDYRIKASNDDPDDYSGTASVSVGVVPCTPTASAGSCTASGVGAAIYSFNIKDGTTTLFDNPANGCDGALSIFTDAHSANVTAGNAYILYASFVNGGSYLSQYLTAWIDRNQDGDFDDSGEMVFQSAGAGVSSFTESFTVPANSLNGSTIMRVRTGYVSGGQVADPCGYITYSETEDYNLNISGGLPVELVNFSGRKQGEEIELNWTTASEEENDYFLIEKSSNGFDFEYMDQLTGRGTTASLQNYSLRDRQPNNGMNYYRMIQVDLDGTKHMQDKVVSVEYFKVGELTINPNPIKESQLRFDFKSAERGDLYVEVFDLRGELLTNRSFKANKGLNHFDIELPDVSNGIYLLRVVKEGEVRTFRFLKE